MPRKAPSGSISAVAEQRMPLAEDTTLDFFPIGAVLSAAQAAIASVIAREIIQNPDLYPEVLSPVDPNTEPAVKALADLVESITRGKDIRAEMPTIQGLIDKQEIRAEVITKLALTQDFVRLSKFVTARQKLESGILAVANQGDLSAGEALAFLDYVKAEVETIEKKVSSSSITGRDVQGLIDQMNILANADAGHFQKKLQATSPQNREIIRRLSHKMAKMAAS